MTTEMQQLGGALIFSGEALQGGEHSVHRE